jgi:hypothetical protein
MKAFILWLVFRHQPKCGPQKFSDYSLTTFCTKKPQLPSLQTRAIGGGKIFINQARGKKTDILYWLKISAA